MSANEAEAAVIVPVCAWSAQRVTDVHDRAYRADLLLRCGVQIGSMSDADLRACARDGSALRTLARAEIKRRARLS